MRGNKHFGQVGKVLSLLAVTLLVTNAWAGHQVVVTFNGSNGANPVAGLIADSSGNFYGTTDTGGTYGFGTVYELSPNGSGGWTETVLHNFQNNNADGTHPFSTLTFDTAGNLYGTTYQGGTHNYGTVFELSPNGGSWSENILHSFDIVDNVGDGAFPEAGIVFNSAGNIIGTTYAGGSLGYGMVYELTPNGNGTWSKAHIHYFGQGTDGRNPNSNLIADAQGDLYGTTYAGGTGDVGTVYELIPNGSGGYTETVLHNFITGIDGIYPVQAPLVFDANGVLYGTCSEGGGSNLGTAYKLTSNGHGGWAKAIIHNFGAGTDGKNPYSGLTIDSHGNLYGTTYNGGSLGFGMVFELSPNGSGGFTETVLHNLFAGSDAAHPYGPLLLDSQGNLYGTSYQGGDPNNMGTVFEITP
jgi:uncharacterized repeat protein (TIGR03803 family)